MDDLKHASRQFKQRMNVIVFFVKEPYFKNRNEEMHVTIIKGLQYATIINRLISTFTSPERDVLMVSYSNRVCSPCVIIFTCTSPLKPQ